MSKYFMFDPEGDGYVEYPTEEQAIAAAKEAIKCYLDDGWDENVERITVGKITHRATQCDFKKRPPEEEIDFDSCDKEGTYWSEWTSMCNYRMEEAK